MSGAMSGSISLQTVATFCEHTAEMLVGVSDSAELIKRHRASLERLRDGLAHSPRMSLSGTQICGLVTVELLHARESGL